LGTVESQYFFSNSSEFSDLIILVFRMQYCNNNGSDDEDDQKCLATTTPFDGQVFILSESGKPIFYRFVFISM